MTPDFQQFAETMGTLSRIVSRTGGVPFNKNEATLLEQAERHARLLAKISEWASTPEITPCKAHVRALLGEPEEKTR